MPRVFLTEDLNASYANPITLRVGEPLCLIFILSVVPLDATDEFEHVEEAGEAGNEAVSRAGAAGGADLAGSPVVASPDSGADAILDQFLEIRF